MSFGKKLFVLCDRGIFFDRTSLHLIEDVENTIFNIPDDYSCQFNGDLKQWQLYVILL